MDSDDHEMGLHEDGEVATEVRVGADTSGSQHEPYDSPRDGGDEGGQEGNHSFVQRVSRNVSRLTVHEARQELLFESFFGSEMLTNMSIGTALDEPVPAPPPPPAPPSGEELPKPPHGWPPLREFPRFYWKRVTGFDQTLVSYGFFPSWQLPIAFVFCCITMVVLSMIDYYGFYPLANHMLSSFLPALGASTTVVFAEPLLPMAQPRNIIFAHVTAGVIGAALTNAFRDVPDQPFGQHCAASIGVGLHLALMQLTNTIHPPASATVVTVATQELNSYFQDQGFFFVVTPVLLGSVIVVVMSWLLNNLVPARGPYPQYW